MRLEAIVREDGHDGPRIALYQPQNITTETALKIAGEKQQLTTEDRQLIST